MRPTQLIGLFMWRSGLLLAGSYTSFRIARLALAYLDVPLELEIGLGLVLAGCILVAVSLIVERVRDARDEDFSNA